MDLVSDSRVKRVFDSYPKHVRPQLLYLRELVLEAASEVKSLEKFEETLKWGEPSYLSKHGSTVRIDWKVKSPNEYAVYFKCTSKLVPTFRHIYPETFKFEGSRAIIFELDDPIPEEELRHCVKLALTYHRVKHLPFLGV